jgi:hypothetical protein
MDRVEAGDLSRPIWTGLWWGEDRCPRQQREASHASSKGAQERARPDGYHERYDNTIAISDENGSNMLEIKAQDGLITIMPQPNVIEAPRSSCMRGASHTPGFGEQLLKILTPRSSRCIIPTLIPARWQEGSLPSHPMTTNASMQPANPTSSRQGQTG